MTVNSLYTCDNLFVLCGMNSESVDLIYLDPPYNSKRTYSASIGSKSAGASFKDMWGWDDVNLAYLEGLYSKYPEISDCIGLIGQIHSKPMMAYVAYMTQRLFELHRILKDTGSIYLHIDPTASHYLKIIMDSIFGKANFRNEIVWSYRTGGASKAYFSRKHDVILAYAKNKKSCLFNTMKERIYYEKPFFNEQKDEKGRYYADVLMTDVWHDVKPIINVSKERTGYPTQKPLALLHRIIIASSNEGDIVFDPFCGCATACVASQQLNRKWIGCDIEEKAAEILVQRLSDDAGMFSDFIHTTTSPQRTDVEKIQPSMPIKDRIYKEQNGKCHGCFDVFEQRHLEIDHVIPKSKGGGDYYENYQLLCGNCNRVKGNRPMEYLLAKVARIKDAKQAVSYD